MCTECEKELTKLGKKMNEWTFLDIIINIKIREYPNCTKIRVNKFRFHYVHIEYLINGPSK